MPETFEFEGRKYRRTGKWEYPKPGDVFWWESHNVAVRFQPDVRAVMLREILEEVPAPPAVQGEPGEAVRELARKIGVGLTSDYHITADQATKAAQKEIAEALAPLLAKVREGFECARENTGGDCPNPHCRCKFCAAEAELARWEPKP